MKALIKDNKVCDVVENEFPVTDEFTWVDCDNTVKQGFSYDGSTFTSNEPTAEEVAQKDVPKGKKYKIVEDSEIPSDWTFRDAWTVSESDLTDGVGTYEIQL